MLATPANATDENENDWECQKCSIKNIALTKRCASCSEPRHARSSSPTVTSAAASVVAKEKYDQTSPSYEGQQKRHDKHSKSRRNGTFQRFRFYARD